jgi:hypothetical protein
VDVRLAMRDCALQRVDAAVLTHGGAGVHLCKFTHVEPTAVVFELKKSTDPGGLRTSSCSVSFHHNGRVCTFLSTLLGTTTEGATTRLRVGLPQMVLVEARRTVRVPVPGNSGLRAKVGVKENWWSPAVRDLSLGGVGLGFHRRDVPEWRIGTLVRVELSLPLTKGVKVTAIVVRRKDQDYGLCFGRNGVITHQETSRRIQVILHRLQMKGTPAPAPERETA